LKPLLLARGTSGGANQIGTLWCLKAKVATECFPIYFTWKFHQFFFCFLHSWQEFWQCFYPKFGREPIRIPLMMKPCQSKTTRGVSHYGLAISVKKYLNKPNEELWKFKYFTMEKYNRLKKSSKRNQNPSRYRNSITNLKFQRKPKYHVSKILL